MTLTPLARPNQPLLKHLVGVGDKAALLCCFIPAWARLIGLLHDYGKYRPEWVEGINEIAQGKDPGKLPRHSVEGALYLLELFPSKPLIAALALMIASHHSGLTDIKEGAKWLKGEGEDPAKKLPSMDSSQWNIDDGFKDALTKAIAAANYKDLENWVVLGNYCTAQRLRFVYGALIAADRQDAAMSDGWQPDSHPTMKTLAETLATWYSEKFSQPKNNLDVLRGDFYAECRKAASTVPGWLSVRGPCGISKTWSVMQMALDHAAQWNKRRIIYCVPWTAILDQSYEQYQERLGENNVLGHWSTLVDPNTQDPKKLRNSRQWWDTPIVATTMVQLFDVLLGSKARTAQRMPSLQDAVIVLDEVQGLPSKLLFTCIKVLDQLVKDHGVTIILSTATMPDYSLLEIQPIEVLPQEKIQTYFDGTRRVEYQWAEEALSWEEMAKAIIQSRQHSTLIVANTVAACDDVYAVMQALPGYQVFKYTASMPPAHRSIVLAEIKVAVAEAKLDGKCIIVCGTSAIETGVDLDCSQGYRESAGLESIVQFAGRINRNMKEKKSTVIIFKTVKSYPLPPESERNAVRASQAMSLGTDLHSPNVLKEYSNLLLQDALKEQEKAKDKENYIECLKTCQWETVSKNWQMIAPTTSVLVNPRYWNAPLNIITRYDEALENANYRILQRHCVSFYKTKYNKAKELQYIGNSLIQDLEEWNGEYDMGVIVNANP